jgi:hypothetical protein
MLSATSSGSKGIIIAPFYVGLPRHSANRRNQRNLVSAQ